VSQILSCFVSCTRRLGFIFCLFFFFLSFVVRVFAEFKDLWQNIRVPEDSEIKRELKKSSFKVVEEEVRRIIVSVSYSRLLLSHKMFADQTLHPGSKEGQEEEDAEDNKDVQQTP